MTEVEQFAERFNRCSGIQHHARLAAMWCRTRSRCTQVSWCTETQAAPASENAGMNSSGFSFGIRRAVQDSEIFTKSS